MFTLPIAAFGLPMGAELWVILGVIVLLFGGAKIPQLMRGVGQGVGELKKGLDEGKKAFTETTSDDKKEEEKKDGEK
jgi:sec-independent protein translocase protein TatA